MNQISQKRPTTHQVGTFPFRLSKVKKQVFHFLQGKIFSALANFFTTLLIVRSLPKEEYASYSVMLGISLTAGVVSSLSMNTATHRYVPEAMVRGNGIILRKLVFFLVAVRETMLLAISVCIIIFAAQIASFFSLISYIHEFTYWGGAIFFIISFQYISIVLETLLLQHCTKWIWMTVALGRIIAILTIIRVSELTLVHVVWVEILAYGLGVLIAISVLLSFLKKKALLKHETQGHNLQVLFNRVIKFSLFDYLRQLLAIMAGTASNRLIVGKVLILSQVASFGFAQSITDLVMRYSPATLLKNLIKPVLMGKFSEDHDYVKLNFMTNVIFKINFFLFAPLIIYTVLFGNLIGELLSSGKYPDVGTLLTGLLILLVFQGHYQILVQQANAAEKNNLVFYMDFIPAMFMIPSIYLLHKYGVEGLIVGRLVGFALRDCGLIILLRKKGLPYRIDVSGLTRLCGIILFTLVITKIAVPNAKNINELILQGIISSIAFIIIAWIIKPFSEQERNTINKILPVKFFIW